METVGIVFLVLGCIVLFLICCTPVFFGTWMHCHTPSCWRWVQSFVDSRARVQAKTLKTPGWKWSYFEAGDKSNPTIVVLHGFSADKHSLTPWCNKLVRNYHLIIPDLPGHGETVPDEDSRPHNADAQPLVSYQAEEKTLLLANGAAHDRTALTIAPGTDPSSPMSTNGNSGDAPQSPNTTTAYFTFGGRGSADESPSSSPDTAHKMLLNHHGNGHSHSHSSHNGAAAHTRSSLSSSMSVHSALMAYGPDEQCDRFAAFIQACLGDKEQFHLAGASMGGGLAGVYASRFPQRVRSVCFLCPAGLRGKLSKLQTMIRNKEPNYLITKNADDIDEMLKHLFYKKPWIPRTLLEEFARLRNFRQEINDKVMADLVKSQGCLSDALPGISAPVIVFWGQDDEIADASGISELYARLPQRPSVYLYSNCGHAVTAEKANDTKRQYLEFLSAVENRTYIPNDAPILSVAPHFVCQLPPTTARAQSTDDAVATEDSTLVTKMTASSMGGRGSMSMAGARVSMSKPNTRGSMSVANQRVSMSVVEEASREPQSPHSQHSPHTPGGGDEPSSPVGGSTEAAIDGDHNV